MDVFPPVVGRIRALIVWTGAFIRKSESLRGFGNRCFFSENVSAWHFC
jgi:hypothetical protein